MHQRDAADAPKLRNALTQRTKTRHPRFCHEIFAQTDVRTVLICVPRRKSTRIRGQTHRYKARHMAIKPPPPPWEVLQQVSDLVGSSGIKGEVDKSVRSLAQGALTRLDVVSREEFDAQAEILQRTRERVVELEAELEQLAKELEAL